MYLGIPSKGQNLSLKNSNTLKQKMKDTNRWKDIHTHGLESTILLY